MVPAAGAVSLAVPADAVVSATDVVPATPVVSREPAFYRGPDEHGRSLHSPLTVPTASSPRERAGLANPEGYALARSGAPAAIAGVHSQS
jgi:hypothetical protein